MPLILESDFTDYYDGAFDRAEPSDDGPVVFTRRLDLAMSRPEMFAVMEARNMNPPMHGRAGDVVLSMRALYRPTSRVVLYPDAYRSDQPLRIVSLDEAQENHADAFCALHINIDGELCSFNHNNDPSGYRRQRHHASVIKRVIWIGHTMYTLERWSADSEFSNRGRTYTRVRDSMDLENRRNVTRLHLPLYAVDYAVFGRYGGCFSIGIDPAPVLQGTGIEDRLCPEEVVRLLKHWLQVDQHARSESTTFNHQYFASLLTKTPLTNYRITTSTNATA